METKNITIRMPLDLWKRLCDLKRDGKINSIQEMAIEAMYEDAQRHEAGENEECTGS